MWWKTPVIKRKKWRDVPFRPLYTQYSQCTHFQMSPEWHWRSSEKVNWTQTGRYNVLLPHQCFMEECVLGLRFIRFLLEAHDTACPPLITLYQSWYKSLFVLMSQSVHSNMDGPSVESIADIKSRCVLLNKEWNDCAVSTFCPCSSSTAKRRTVD